MMLAVCWRFSTEWFNDSLIVFSKVIWIAWRQRYNNNVRHDPLIVDMFMPDGVICIETIAKRDHFQTLSVRRKSCSSPLDLHKHSVFQTGNVGRFETTAMDNRVKLLHYQSLPFLHQTSERTFTTFISQRLLCRNLTTTPQINTTKANSKFIQVFDTLSFTVC